LVLVGLVVQVLLLVAVLFAIPLHKLLQVALLAQELEALVEIL
jgi:hypothetical protein